MRDILNQLKIIAEGVGLANRQPGDLFKNPQGDNITFQRLEFYPTVGKFGSEEELSQAVEQATKQKNIQWVNVYNPKKFGAFAIATFTGANNQEYYLGKYLPEIKANRRDNKFQHEEIPGDFKYMTGRGATENAGYQPSQVLTKFENLTPQSIAEQIIKKFGDDSDEARAITIFLQARDFPVTIPGGNMNFNAFAVYFCEMLQPIAFVKGMTVKGNAQDCVNIYFGPGQTLAGASISFNSEKGGMLSDSSLTNNEGKTIFISTKDAAGGAKASAQNLKIELDKIKSTPKGSKLLAKHGSVLEIVNRFGKNTHYSAPLEIATDANLITPNEAQQVMALRQAGLGLGEDPKPYLSKKLMDWYNEYLAKWKKPVVPVHTMMLIIATKVANYVNTQTNFSEAASEILNNGALIQVNTMIKQAGDNFVFEGLNGRYPGKAVTGVQLTTEKAYWTTGEQGNMTFKILFNNAKPSAVDSADNIMNEPTTAEPIDLDVVAQQRSGITARAGGVDKNKKEPRYNEKAYGRPKQR